MKVRKIVRNLFTVVLMLLMVVLPAQTVAAAEESVTISQEEVYERIMAKKESYPEGKAWTDANRYYFSVFVDGVSYTGTGCAAFAFILSDAGFGDGQFPARKYYEYDNIRVGDILRISNDTHSVVVLSIVGDVVTIAEGNYNNSIHWGRTLSLTQLQNGGIVYGITRYPVEYSQELAGPCGDSWDGNNVIWELSEDGVLTIKGTGKMKNWSGRSGKEAPWYAHIEKIKKVVIEKGVTHIGDCAFADCKNLVEISVPNTVTSIGADAFYYCSGLKQFSMPDSVTEVDNGAFTYCTSLEEVKLSNQLATLSSHMFSNCMALKEITIPESVTAFSDMVFNGCKSLHYLYIPNSVTTVADAYQNFANITVLCEDDAPIIQCVDEYTVICPKSQWSGTCGEGLTYHFDRNTGTLTITGTGEVAYDDTFGENVFAGYKAVKNIVLKDFAGTELPTYFYGWPNVEFFEIPEGVTRLDYNTFADCDSLKYVVVPASVENIRNSFWGNSDTFEIRGYTGTKIEAYAKKEGITFVSLGVSLGKPFASYQGYNFYMDDNANVTCYDSLGNQVINEFKCDGTYTYYFQADGTAMKDRLTYHPDGVQIIYFDSEGHEVFSDFANVKMTIEGKPVDDYCFFDVYGNLYVDVITYDKEGKKLYYANPYGVMDRNKWFEFSDTVKWANGTPFDKAGGRYGCAAADGSLITNTWTYDWEGRFCYLQGNGVAVYY